MWFEDCPKDCYRWIYYEQDLNRILNPVLSSKIMLFYIFDDIIKSKGANLQESQLN